MRSVPHRGLSRDIRAISSRTSRLRRGRPNRVRDLQVQYRRQPLRCQPITVSGCTILSCRDHPSGQSHRIQTQKIRSRLRRRGFGLRRMSTSSWCRRTRFSSARSSRGRLQSITTRSRIKRKPSTGARAYQGRAGHRVRASDRLLPPFNASGILRDGRVIVVGGEQSGAGGDTNRGEIYDPVADSWTPISLPPWPQVGDAVCCVLPEGRLMIGSLPTPECLIYDPATDSWTAAANKAVRSNEETWILLPDETIVTVQCWEPYRSERYSTSSNAWKDEGKPPVMLVDPVMHEIGPAMLMYDGKVIWFGAANAHGRGKTAIYTPPPIYTGTGTWAVGPDIPPVGNRPMVCNDCPASLMPNGKVLFTAAPYQFNNWGSPISFFEYDPFTNTIVQAPTPPNNAMQLYWSRMMLLPTGQVLFGPSINNLQCYTPDGEPQEAWRPTIHEVIPHCTRAGTDYYLLRGTQLNGLSQANTYGDDCYPATNYPLVRLRSMQTNEAYFCRTYAFSTMGVATGGDLESVRFDARHVPFGDFELCVIANGISSHCVSFCHRRSEQPCELM